MARFRNFSITIEISIFTIEIFCGVTNEILSGKKNCGILIPN